MKKVNRPIVYVVSIITIILLIGTCTGCVNQRVPNNEAKASRKMEKHLNGVKKITAVYPDLVDSVSAPVIADVKLDSGLVEAPELEVDTTAVNAALSERDLIKARYDSLVAQRDSTDYNQILEDEIAKAKRSLKAQTQVIVESVFSDTTIFLTKSIPLYIGQDTLQINVTATTTVRGGVPNTVFTIAPIQDQVVLNHEYPIFEVYQKMPKSFRYGIILLIAVILLLIAWKVVKKVLL